jgi:predicted  nucleic acid-binding Zn-ribbon protein
MKGDFRISGFVQKSGRGLPKSKTCGYRKFLARHPYFSEVRGRLPKVVPGGMLARLMKNRIGILVLALACLGLGIGLVMSRKQASDQAERIESLSNEWVKVQGNLDHQQQVNTALTGDLDTTRKVLTELSNQFSSVSANLAQTTEKLATTETSLKTSQEELAKREAKINDLENQNQQLDKQATDLSNAITNLNTQITDTQRKLTASEGDKAFLEKELQRLTSEKAELERQFNDLAVLRSQVAKLKEELNISRRIEWIRQGIFASAEQKGAQKLMQGLTVPQMQARAPKPAYDLNVEVSADGSVKVIPPLTGRADATNAPPAK